MKAFEGIAPPEVTMFDDYVEHLTGQDYTVQHVPLPNGVQAVAVIPSIEYAEILTAHNLTQTQEDQLTKWSINMLCNDPRFVIDTTAWAALSKSADKANDLAEIQPEVYDAVHAAYAARTTEDFSRILLERCATCPGFTASR